MQDGPQSLAPISSDTVRQIADDASLAMRCAKTIKDLDNVRVNFFGKKGAFTGLMKGLKDLQPAQRKSVGELLNVVKQELDELLEGCQRRLSTAEIQEKLASERIDVTLPVNAPITTNTAGSLHPLTRVQRELEAIFRGLGFTLIDGPELEREYYNFEALNIPATHPARDMQDTLWTADGNLLRTHTSSMQVRALEKMEPPIRIVAPGRVYRPEKLDASHEHTFYQMEGMMIDKNVTVGHVIYFMKTLLREIFGEEQKIRLRPGFFPFVEPGFELDIWFKGRWMELLPCGLVHPKVLEYGGIDPKKWQGFAFGLGLSRLVMSRYQIDDIRYLQSGDLRFLQQFR